MKGTGIKFKLRFALVFLISLIVGLFIGLPPFEPSVLGQSAQKLMSAIADDPVSSTPTPIPDYKGEIIRLTNVERIKAGLGALRENGLLDKAAKDKAEDLINRRYWAHYVPAEGENSTWKFITSAGYDYRYAGENLGRGYTDPKSLLSSWMVSNEHKKNILDGRYTEIGVHVARGRIGLEGGDEQIAVQAFGTPYNQIEGTSNANTTNKKTFPADADPVITCNVSANCGGGTRLMKKSVCENSICCQVGGSWIFYEDKNN